MFFGTHWPVPVFGTARFSVSAGWYCTFSSTGFYVLQVNRYSNLSAD